MEVLYLKPWDDSQYHKTFCPKCFLYIWADEVYGCNYCPNCGVDLQWKPGSDKHFKQFYEMSQKLKNTYYKDIKEEEH
jgi:hypothetical protein